MKSAKRKTKIGDFMNNNETGFTGTHFLPAQKHHSTGSRDSIARRECRRFAEHSWFDSCIVVYVFLTCLCSGHCFIAWKSALWNTTASARPKSPSFSLMEHRSCAVQSMRRAYYFVLNFRSNGRKREAEMGTFDGVHWPRNRSVMTTLPKNLVAA